MQQRKPSTKCKPYRKKYYATILERKNHYIGIVTCPKCGKQGYCEKITQKNKNTNYVSFIQYLIKHYIRSDGKKRIYSHCIIYDETTLNK